MAEQSHHKMDVERIDELIRWLNEPPNKKDGERRSKSHFMGLIEMTHLSAQLVRKKSMKALMGFAQQELDACVASPRLIVEGKRLSHRWVPDKRADKWEQRRSRMFYEILLFAEKGILWRVRRCAYDPCKQWFYAKSGKKIFHSKNCAKRASQLNPEVSSKRRKSHTDYQWRTRLHDRLIDKVSRKDIRGAFITSQKESFTERLGQSVQRAMASLTSDRTVRKVGLDTGAAERLAMERLRAARDAEGLPMTVANMVVDVTVQLLFEKRVSGREGSSKHGDF